MDAYSDDLAYIHDAGFGDFTRGAAPGILKALRRNGVMEGLVVDLGCGSGIWAEILLAEGYDVLGVDLSPGMLALARRRAPEATLREASLHEVELPRCAAVTALGECVNYLFDPDADVPAFTTGAALPPPGAHGVLREKALVRHGELDKGQPWTLRLPDSPFGEA